MPDPPVHNGSGARLEELRPSSRWVAGPCVRVARLLNRSFPKSYAVLSSSPRLFQAYRSLRFLEKSAACHRLSRLSFNERRASNTVFIFGTGASLNEYPDEWWDVVRSHDSIGMNFFLLHEHVPTFHVMESVHGIRRQLLEARYVERGDYQDVPLIVKTQLSNLSSSRVDARIKDLMSLRPEVLTNAYLPIDLLVAGKNTRDVEASYRLSARLGLWTPKDRFLILTKRRGSVAYLLNFAVRAGYRRIVLCGVDLNHTEYFYDSRRQELESAGLPVPINTEPGEVHSTNDPAKHPVTMHHVILAIKRVILDPAGIELMVGAESSALHPDLSRFDWERELDVSNQRPRGSA